MKFTPVPELPEIVVIEPEIFGDARGYFMELYHREKYEKAGIRDRFVQDNHSRSSRGVLRGLHYQLPPAAQGKLVRCVAGEVFDVAVDLRKSSLSFGRWIGVHLSAENQRQVWIPPGFAHGFLVLSESADFLYKTTDYYSPEYERCVLWNDPDLAVAWPLEIDPALSPKDQAGTRFSIAELFA